MRTILFAISVATFFSIAGWVRAESGTEPIKIGSILILSGEGSGWGKNAQNGIEMAIDRINDNGGLLGRKVVVEYQDDRGDPKSTIAAFRELTDVKNIHFIIGPTWSNLGIAIAEPAKLSKTVVISPSIGITTFTSSNKFLFSTWPHDSKMSERLAEYVFAKGRRNVALVGAEHVWVKEQTNAFKARFEKLGGTIGYLFEPTPGTTDVRTAAARIRNTPGVEAIVSTTDGVQVGSLVIRALRDLKSALPVYSIDLDQSAVDAAKGALEGSDVMTGFTPSPEFEKEYEQRFKTDVDAGADTAYDAVMLLVHGIRETQSLDAEKVADYLSTVKRFDGVSGELVMNELRGFSKSFALKKIVNGKAVRSDRL